MKIVIFLVSLFSIAYGIDTSIKKVDAFVTCGTDVNINSSIESNVYEMGCDKSLNAELNQLIKKQNFDIKSNEIEIAAMTEKFVDAHKKQYAESYTGQAKADIAGIGKYPAYVFNDKYVVYGTSDFNQAKAKYFSYRG